VPGVYIRQGKYSEAEPLCQRALAIDEKALGPNHPNVATNLNNLAELYRAQGKYSEGVRSSNHDRKCDRRDGWDGPKYRPQDYTRALVSVVAWIDSIRAKWRSSPSAYGSTPTTTLDRADVVRDGRVTVSFAAQPIAKCPAKTFDTP